MPAKGTPRLIDSRLANSRLALSLLDDAYTLASPTPALQALTQAAPIRRKLQRFRYRVNFINAIINPTTGLPDPNNQGVLETPFLDDITFRWQPASGPKFLSWEER